MKKRILIVEDESLIAADLRLKLVRLGYTVIAVEASGEKAVTQAEATKPDLVLMDVRLQGTMTGIEAARAIKQSLDIPIVFLTAFARLLTSGDLSFIKGKIYVLPKPFSLGALERTIGDAFESAHIN